MGIPSEPVKHRGHCTILVQTKNIPEDREVKCTLHPLVVQVVFLEHLLP